MAGGSESSSAGVMIRLAITGEAASSLSAVRKNVLAALPAVTVTAVALAEHPSRVRSASSGTRRLALPEPIGPRMALAPSACKASRLVSSGVSVTSSSRIERTGPPSTPPAALTSSMASASACSWLGTKGAS